jgi:serine protease inhibitor
MDSSASAVQAVNGLGLDLHRARALARPEENAVLSPYSLQLALAMAFAGAEGETRAEMQRVLRYPPEEDLLHEGLAGLTARLKKRMKECRDRGGRGRNQGLGGDRAPNDSCGRTPSTPIQVHIDHPFLFAIQETRTGACLLLGRVTDPR